MNVKPEKVKGDAWEDWTDSVIVPPLAKNIELKHDDSDWD
jgi:hypothetical protein